MRATPSKQDESRFVLIIQGATIQLAEEKLLWPERDGK
jgi:hypothetical protein